MASRTNKMWILKKKKQLEKIKSIKKWWKRYLKTKNLSDNEKLEKWLIFSKTNPKHNTYKRDKSGRKIICVDTWLREDLDGYRLIFKANSSELLYKPSGIKPALRRIIRKKKIKL